MDEMSQQGQLYFHSESIHFRGTNISQPNMCTVVVRETIDSHYLLDAYDNEMVYGMTQYDGVRHQPNLDIGVPVSSSSAASSSVAPHNARHTDIGIPLLPRFGSSRSMMARDSNHLIQGNYLGDQHFQPEAPLQPDQQLTSNNNNGDHTLAWYQSLPMSYVQAPITNANLSSLENARMDLQRYHGSRRGQRYHGSRSGQRYHGSRRGHRFRHPVQEIIGHSINFHPPVTAPSYRVPRNPSSSSSMPIQNAPFAGAHMHHPQPPRGNMHETPPRHRRNLLPPETFLQYDDVPSLGDDHSDMRLDIEDMSYEELLLLGERIGNVGTGLLEEIIARQMKTKTYLLPNNLEGSTSEEQETDLCIICQDEYKNKEEIGILQCGHGYHADCIRRWLHEKNVCPMCKSKALTIE